jgi:hypothetical protein
VSGVDHVGDHLVGGHVGRREHGRHGRNWAGRSDEASVATDGKISRESP